MSLITVLLYIMKRKGLIPTYLFQLSPRESYLIRIKVRLLILVMIFLLLVLEGGTFAYVSEQYLW